MHVARKGRHAGPMLVRQHTEPGELRRHGVLELRVGVFADSDLEVAQVAARRQREPRFAPRRLRQRGDERRQVVEPQEVALEPDALDALAAERDVGF